VSSFRFFVRDGIEFFTADPFAHRSSTVPSTSRQHPRATLCILRGAGPFCLALRAVLLLALPAAAAPMTLLEQARVFSDRAGRYAGMTEHQWMFDGPASEDSARRRDQFADLPSAVSPDREPQVTAEILEWRVAARAAQRELLDTAAFVADRSRQQRAGRLASGYLAACDRLIAGP
jgi:hypothetical protein